jgi:flavin-dependent dehydrogenase
MEQNQYDVIIVGAGPAGLSAAYFCATSNKKVLVIEKQKEPGPFPRGETLHDDAILDELLGSGVMKSLQLHLTADRLYHSPFNIKSAVRIAKTPSIVFEWRAFIEKIYERCQNLQNIQFLFNTDVLGPIYSEESNACVGVFTKDARYYAHSVIAANGHTSSIGNSLGIKYDSEMNLPMVKCLITGFRSEYTGFEYFFFVENQFKEFPKYPSGVAFIFPRNADHCEIGFMLFTHISSTSIKNNSISDSDLMKLWAFLKQNLPGFSDRIKNVKIQFEMPTRLPNVRLLENLMPRPGLFLIGDAAGMVEASGGSGLIAGIKAGKLVAEIINEQGGLPWDKKTQERSNKTIKESVVYKKLKKNYALVGTFQRYLFGKLKTADKINKKWKIVQIAYKLI